MNKTLTTIKSKHFQLLYQSNETIHNLLQISFGKDGSIYFGSEFFKNPLGSITIAEVPPGAAKIDIPFQDNPVLRRLITKTSLHVSGQTHVTASDAKEKIGIRQISPMTHQTGHLFTIQIQGFEFFGHGQTEAMKKFPGPLHSINTTEYVEAIRVVAWYYHINDMMARIPNKSAQLGPNLPLYNETDKKMYAGTVISPLPEMQNADKAIILQYIPTEKFDQKNRGCLLTLSAFDEEQIARDVNSPTKFRLTQQVTP